jgi:hypothetical protein
LGGHERILRRQVEQRLVTLQFLVAEDPEGGVAGAVTLDDGGRTAAEDLAFRLDTIAFATSERRFRRASSSACNAWLIPIMWLFIPYTLSRIALVASRSSWLNCSGAMPLNSMKRFEVSVA